MSLKPVRSGNVKAVGYDPATRVLTMHFHSGTQHSYADVSPEHYKGLMGEGVIGHSVGKYFHAHIKSAHKSSKVE